MGWSLGTNNNGREVGYGVPAVCDFEGCEAEIDRGLSYACGENHDEGENEYGAYCEWYYCYDHLNNHKCAMDVERRFRDLAITWKFETAFVSSMTEIIANQNYREIVELGPLVIPILLHEMEVNPNHWSPALRELTGANPVKYHHQGEMDRIAQDWVEWGEEQEEATKGDLSLHGYEVFTRKLS